MRKVFHLLKVFFNELKLIQANAKTEMFIENGLNAFVNKSGKKTSKTTVIMTEKTIEGIKTNFDLYRININRP